MNKYHEIMDLQEQLSDKEFVRLYYETFGIERLFEDFKDYVRSIEDEKQYDEVLSNIKEIMEGRTSNDYCTKCGNVICKCYKEE